MNKPQTVTNREVKNKLAELYDEVFAHDGYGDIRIEIRILRRGQKEVIVHCGKQYRYVVNFKSEDRRNNSLQPPRKDTPGSMPAEHRGPDRKDT